MNTCKVCAEFRKRFNGFDQQSDEYIKKNFGVIWELRF
jgi:hypothetical protein